MNILDSILKNEKSYTATVLSNSQTVTNGIASAKTWTRGKAFDCLFWRSGMSGTIFGQMFKSDVSAYLVARPSDVSKSDLPAGKRVIIEDKAGTLSGTVSGNHSAADITVEVVMDATDFALIKANDVLIIGSAEYTIISAAGTTPQTITITPGLTGSVSSGATMTVQAVTVINKYEIIYADDVAGQGQVLNVPLKEI